MGAWGTLGFYGAKGGAEIVILGRGTVLSADRPIDLALGPQKRGGQAGGMHVVLLVCDPHCARYIAPSHELAGTPSGASRHGRGIANFSMRNALGRWNYILFIRLFGSGGGGYIFLFLGPVSARMHNAGIFIGLAKSKITHSIYPEMSKLNVNVLF